MKEIQLGGSLNLTTMVDDEDYEKLLDVGNWSLLKTYNGHLYAKHDWKDVSHKKKRGSILMHRFIMGVHEDNDPWNHPVDHKNRNGLDNRKFNLRVTSCSINNFNKVMQSNNVSGVTGVYWNNQKQKWHAEISFQRRKIHVGFFTTIEAAAAARQERLNKLWLSLS